MAEPYKFQIEGEEFEFLPETFDIKEQTQLAYSQAYGFYLKNGIMTKAQAMELGRKNGVVDEEWDDKVQLHMLELINTTAELEEERTKKRRNAAKIEKLKGEAKKHRAEYERLTVRQNELLQDTCENLAENRAIEFSVVLRLVDVNGNHVFSSHEDFVGRYNEKVAFESTQHMLYLKYGLPFRLEGFFPEDQPDKEPAKKKVSKKKVPRKKAAKK